MTEKMTDKMRDRAYSYVRVLCMNEIELANNIDTISRTGNTILARILLDPKMNYEVQGIVWNHSHELDLHVDLANCFQRVLSE